MRSSRPPFPATPRVAACSSRWCSPSPTAMVTGWVLAGALNINVTAVAFGGLGVLLATSVLTVDDISQQGDTLATFLWLAVLFALSAQLNELGFMGFVGERLASHLEG